jgi:uncharacterized protein YdhG (YjbR/CyaY superfamily)
MSPAKKTAAKTAAKSAAKTTAAEEPENFTAEERAAMKDRARELKATRRGSSKPTAQDLADEVVAKIAGLEPEDRMLGERLHALITAAAPELAPKLWYGMPAYARDGKIVVFFQPASKFKARYATLGFSDQAKLDDGEFWPTSYAVGELTAADEKKITALVKKAAG